MAERHTCTVTGTPADVFAYITDQSRLPEWNRDVVSSRTVDPPLREGATIEQVRRDRGEEVPALLEVAEYEAPKRYRVRGDFGNASIAIAIQLEPVAGGTRVSMGQRARITGFRKFFGGKIEKSLDEATAQAMRVLPDAFGARNG